MPPVMAVAKFIVQSADGPISNLKLQKLLYYVQGWNLGIRGKPVFHSSIQAWAHGPVVPEAFQVLRHLGWRPIPVATETITLESQIDSHIRSVLHAYGKFSATDLERLSHTEKPWLDARGDLPPDAPSQAIITLDSMKEFFGQRVNGKKE
jgi:uncharacterized phage-associated protein